MLDGSDNDEEFPRVDRLGQSDEEEENQVSRSNKSLMIEEEFIVPTRREKTELILARQSDPANPVRIDSFDKAMAEL